MTAGTDGTIMRGITSIIQRVMMPRGSRGIENDEGHAGSDRLSSFC
jgi:hypothetical protein